MFAKVCLSLEKSHLEIFGRSEAKSFSEARAQVFSETSAVCLLNKLLGIKGSHK